MENTARNLLLNQRVSTDSPFVSPDVWKACGGPLLPFDHKTVFTLLSWITFGVLLMGRRLRGWRGRIALRYTLSGLALLLLAYAGSRFVLEMVLHR